MSWDNTQAFIDVAGKPRKCHICGKDNAIKTGENLLVFNSNSMYSKNMCKDCLKKFAVDIDKKICLER